VRTTKIMLNIYGRDAIYSADVTEILST